MQYLLLIIFLLLPGQGRAVTPESPEVTLALSHYPPFVVRGKDGIIGDFPDYLGRFFAKAGHRVRFVEIPYARTLRAVSTGGIPMGIFGLANLKTMKTIVASKPFFISRLCALYSKDRYPAGRIINELTDLKKYNVITEIDSPINNVLKDLKIPFHQVTRTTGAIRMLAERQSVDFFLTDHTIVKEVVRTMPEPRPKIGCAKVINEQQVVVGVLG